SEPEDFVGVATGMEFTCGAATEEINQDVVIEDLVAFSNDAVEDAEEFAGLNGQAGFFASFADGSIFQQFSDFEHATWNGPLSEERRVSPLDQHHALILDDDGAGSNQRHFGVL